MSSNSRWFLDTQHSFSFKAEHKIRVVLSNSKYSYILVFIQVHQYRWLKIEFITQKYSTSTVQVLVYTSMTKSSTNLRVASGGRALGTIAATGAVGGRKREPRLAGQGRHAASAAGRGVRALANGRHAAAEWDSGAHWLAASARLALVQRVVEEVDPVVRSATSHLHENTLQSSPFNSFNRVIHSIQFIRRPCN